MPEAPAARWSPAQPSMLRELGCELFALRPSRHGDAALAQGDDVAASAPGVDGPASTPRGGGASSAPRDRATASAPRDRVTASAPRDGVAAFAPVRERRVLVMLSPEANLLRGPHAALVRALLKALGVNEDDVRGEPVPGAPTLAFGLAAAGATCAPALDALRSGAAKRALWPALRALRARLRAADARG